MKKTIYKCDRCGKPINKNAHDLELYNLGIAKSVIKIDLCKVCANYIKNLIKQETSK